ncbi:hypothetical protein PCC7418_2570 [Halothece sp. PCC 7418]|uniref:hypothetical protein n=1 Tax=Halothece sp. (strain PCC 7418) TaxID=65093 RepID=UPI0002A08588|nr:hypothetical protein [Halothece sp. PCC 7418]AFZ44713.1 hypothetical protein PCC7418_2570 [Halothece sp. PCC 7418]
MVLTAEKTKLQALHTQYVEATQQNYPHAYVFSLEEIMANVAANTEPTDDIDALTKSVLEAMVYTASNTIGEMVERAEADFVRRFEKMNPEQQRVCTQYRLKFQ